MFEAASAPPFYTDLYNFKDGAQNDIFIDSYARLPTPSPDNTDIPTPLSHDGNSSGGESNKTPPGESPNPNNGQPSVQPHSNFWYIPSFHKLL